MPAIPRTFTGKKLELPVKRILTGVSVEEVVSQDMLIDPDSIEAFAELRAQPVERMTLRRLDHALVLTDDLEATTAFYRDALGFERGDRPPLPFPGHWLYLDGAACLHVAERAAYEAHAASVGLAAAGASIDHVAFAAEAYDESRLASKPQASTR